MTLDEMYIETAMYCDEAINKTNGAYQGKDLAIVEKFKTAINYAYKKICREKYPLVFTETVSSDSPLSKVFYKLVSLASTETGQPIDYKIIGDSINYNYDGQVDITYEYVPEELINLNDVPEFSYSVDHRILCYFAAFQYFNIDDDDRAIKWLNLWNEAFDSISKAKETTPKIENVFSLGWEL